MYQKSIFCRFIMVFYMSVYCENNIWLNKIIKKQTPDICHLFAAFLYF